MMIVEGPAGSGKSYLCRKLIQRYGSELELVELPKLIKIDRPRDYQDDGERLSLYKDAVHLAVAVTNADQSGKIQVIDRCFLSQLVYGSIRAKLVFVNPFNVTLTLVSAQEVLKALILNLNSRFLNRSINSSLVLASIKLNFLILLPSPAMIETNRAKTGNSYPFSVYDELERYRGISSLLKNYQEMTEWEDTITVNELGYVSYDHFDRVFQETDFLHR